MSGDKAAVELALAQKGDGPGTDEEQLGMEDALGLPKTRALNELREKTAKLGRPLGARNKRTIEWANFLLSRYTSPLVVLAQIANANIDELVAGLGCTALEALQEKEKAARDLAPYVHAKMPVAVDINSRREIHLTIVEGLPDHAGGVGLVETVMEKINPKQIDALAKPVGEA